MKSLLLATAASLALAASPTLAQEGHAGHGDHAPPSSPVQTTAPEAAPAAPPAAADPHAGHTISVPTGDAGMEGMAEHGMSAMSGALGSYPMTREASGTSWQPDASIHEGGMEMQGPWMFMRHATLQGVYSWQEGPRGDEMPFLAGMVMLSAQRTFENMDSLNLRLMLSPDPFMGKRGYPVLLASGETADGLTPLVDRQHPHDLFMELSATYTHRFTDRDSVFLYAGLPGEPAFGPPAFMHRMSIMDSPEAPISHHWLDSTHITFGVLTAGWVHNNWKVEASRFRGREPDEHRYNIETGKLDSTAFRVSWNPTENWSLQGSWADVTSPEQLEPDDDQKKWSASAIYTRRIGSEGWVASTLAWGRRSGGHTDLDAWVFETAVKPNEDWTVFGRAERTDNNELTSVGGHHGPVYTVSKASVGAIRDWKLNDRATIGLGALYAFNFVPSALERSYGGDPNGAMAFVRLKLR